MAILFMDSFDDDSVAERWTTGDEAPSASYGIFGSKGVRLGDVAGKITKAAITRTGDYWHAMFHCRPIGGGAVDGLLSIDLDGNGTWLAYNAGDPYITVNSNKILAGAGTMGLSVWTHIEIEIYYHASAGTIKVWFDGELLINGSALNTGTTPSTQECTLGANGSSVLDNWDCDNFIMGDGSGSYHGTGQWGEMAIEHLLPSGNGNSSVLVGSDGNSTDNYLLVDEEAPDTADYVGSGTEGDKDTYAITNMADNTKTVEAVMVESLSAKTDAGAKFGRNVVRVSSTDYPEASVALATSYGLQHNILEEDPATTAAWLGSAIDAIEAGFEVRDS